MGRLADSTGLAPALGHWVSAQFPGIGTAGLTVVFTGWPSSMSEAASNTAAANIVVPIAIAVSHRGRRLTLRAGAGRDARARAWDS